jgi:hypothetical protein
MARVEVIAGSIKRRLHMAMIESATVDMISLSMCAGNPSLFSRPTAWSGGYPEKE